jgi:predicted GIY-YIG superfamily endonuclease
MGKKWVYVLKNTNNEYNDIYIGETLRLFRRFNEHLEGYGAKNTSDFQNVELIGLYDVIQNNIFIEYHSQIKFCFIEELNNFTFDNIKDEIKNNDNGKTLSLFLENRITERFMHIYKNSNNYNIVGGKYTKGNYIKNFSDTNIIDRPLCKCNLPCEVFLSKQNDFWFKCPLTNTEWIDFSHDNFNIAESCDFFEKYKDDITIKTNYTNFQKKINNVAIYNIPKIEKHSNNVLSCVICHILNYNPIFNKGFRQLCKNCVVNKYDEIINYKKPKIQFINDD